MDDLAAAAGPGLGAETFGAGENRRPGPDQDGSFPDAVPRHANHGAGDEQQD
jgi:hypothetical protein